MPRDQRKFSRREVSLDHVQVGPAKAASPYANAHFAGARLGVGNLPELEGVFIN